MLLYIILAIFLFGVLIAVHEWGHYITAKKLNVQVNEFALGMGPKIYSKQKGETLYSLRAFPIGGFCAMEGEDEETENPRSFNKKPLWVKLIILCAGSFMNLLLGFFIVLALTIANPVLTAPVIAELSPQFSTSGDSTLVVGDRIVSINGHKVRTVPEVKTRLDLSGGKDMELSVKRDGELVTLGNFTMIPYLDTNSWGEEYYRFGINFTQLPVTPVTILKHCIDTTGFYARSVWMGLQMIAQGDAGFGDLAGPVGIVSLIGETSSKASSVTQSVFAGLQNVCGIIALVAVNLAIINMLPIPALDGGRIFLLLIGAGYHLLTRRELNPKIEQYLNATFLLLLMLLMLLVTFQDVWKLVI